MITGAAMLGTRNVVLGADTSHGGSGNWNWSAQLEAA